MERHQVDQIVNLGDVSFRGPAPRECWEAVRAMGALPFDHRIEAYGKRIRFIHGSQMVSSWRLPSGMDGARNKKRRTPPLRTVGFLV